ncbi:MAG: hypothetical protein KDA89_07885, partial [Planctomycetaceae bacterium]|nr:hypothetical protein [Planctomycetaceae bacterium]
MAAASEIDVSSISARREYLASLRAEAAARQCVGSGIAISEWYSDQLDDLLRVMLSRHIDAAGIPHGAAWCLAAVGGNGRRRPAPYSDLDLLMVAGPRLQKRVEPVLSDFVRDCWDTGFQLGHSIRTPDDVAAFAAEDLPFATSLVSMRLLLGNAGFFAQLQDTVQRRVFSGPTDRFVSSCVAARRSEWLARGDSVNQLEPDVKRSPGGLRDLHLLSWVAFAQFGRSDPEVLLEHNAISRDELDALRNADEFLTDLRLSLHCRSKLKQDVLSRELQLAIARDAFRRNQGEASEPATYGTGDGGKPAAGPNGARRIVEGFMQDYFRHTSRVAEIARRVAEVEQRPTLLSRIRNVILSPRDLDGFTIIEQTLNADDSYGESLSKNPEEVMRAFVTAARHGVGLSADLRMLISSVVPRLPADP